MSSPGIGCRHDDDPIHTTEAPSDITGTSERSTRIGPPISSSYAPRHCSSDSDSTSPGGGPPAFISMPSSDPPKRLLHGR